MNPTVIGQLIGGLAITLLISRLILLVLKKWDGGIKKFAIAHALSVAICITAYAFGSADGGPPNWSAGSFYLLPQLVWFLFDVVRDRRKQTG